jgi:hypothetical protein
MKSQSFDLRGKLSRRVRASDRVIGINVHKVAVESNMAKISKVGALYPT